jgi:hypothetical protein
MLFPQFFFSFLFFVILVFSVLGFELTIVKQVLYHLSHTVSCFSIVSEVSALAHLDSIVLFTIPTSLG